MWENESGIIQIQLFDFQSLFYNSYNRLLPVPPLRAKILSEDAPLAQWIE